MAVFGLASIVGPITGGWITDTWEWCWAFYVNIPVGALALLTAGLTLPTQIRRRQHAIDYLGAAALIAAAVSLLLAFSWGGSEYPWNSLQIVGLLVVSLVLWAIFVGMESRVAEPILSPELFRNRIFTVSIIATFLVAGGMFGTMMFLPLFAQGVIGESATNAGAVITPMMLGFMVSSAIGGQIMSRTGRYKMLALFGFALATVGIFLLDRMDASASSGLAVRNMVITGLGIGVMTSLFTIIVQNAFPTTQLGHVTASVQFFRSIGGTISVAVLGSLMVNHYQDAFQTNLPAAVRQAVPPERLAALQDPQVLLSAEATARIQQSFTAMGPHGQMLFDQLMQMIRISLASAITELFLVGAAAMALGFIVTLFLQEIPLRGRHSIALAGKGLESGRRGAAAVAGQGKGQEEVRQ